jgi:hypothetical protein
LATALAIGVDLSRSWTVRKTWLAALVLPCALALALPAQAIAEDPGRAGPAQVQRSLPSEQHFQLFLPVHPAPTRLVAIFLDARAERAAYEALAELLASHGCAVALWRGTEPRAEEASELGALAERLQIDEIGLVAVGLASGRALDLLPGAVRPLLIDPADDDASRELSRSPHESLPLLLLRSEAGPCRRSANALTSDLYDKYSVLRIELQGDSLCHGHLSLLARRLITDWVAYYSDVQSQRAQRWLQEDSARVEASREERNAPSSVAQFNLSLELLLDGRVENSEWSAGIGGGFRPEIVFGRRSARSWGAGGYLEVSATSDTGVAFGAGTTLLVPLWQRPQQFLSAVVLAPSLGGYLKNLDGFEPGASASLFFGYRAFNSLTSFDGALGLRIEGQWGLGPSRERALILGAQMDLMDLVATGAMGGLAATGSGRPGH